jgi:DNA-binding transcriptional LysR family regulator
MADRKPQVFRAVAKHLFFTCAAGALLVTQPGVPFQIRRLEAHFGTRLLDGGRGQIPFTLARVPVPESAERGPGLFSEMDVRLAEMTLRISSPLQVGGCTALAEFSSGHKHL